MRSLLLLILLVAGTAKADTHTLGILGAGATVAGPELNYTFEKQGIFYNAAAFEIDKGETSFSFGVGYREEIVENLYLGGMGAFLFTRIDKSGDEEIRDFGPSHFVPLGHSVGFLPWVTLEKQMPIDDAWAFSFQLYANHLAGHLSLGFTYKGAP